MNNIFYYLIFIAIFALIIIIFTILKNKYIKSMSKTLYIDNNPDLYLKRLDNIEGKIYLNKKVRLFRKIDGYAINQDESAVIDTFKKLESLKLSFGQKITLYEKEVSYYIQNKKYDEAKIANNNIQELSKMVEIEDLKKISDDCNALIGIYVNKDSSFAPLMVKNGDSASIDSIKGTYYYRAAKCYYYRKDNKMINKYLEKADKYLNNTSIHKVITECIKDHNNIENTNI